MDYKFDSYLFDICYFCNQLTGKNYTYSRNKHQAKIQWFNDGKKCEYNLDVQLYYGPLNIRPKDVAEMVVRSSV